MCVARQLYVYHLSRAAENLVKGQTNSTCGHQKIFTKTRRFLYKDFNFILGMLLILFHCTKLQTGLRRLIL